jgi:hypothetical protein
MNQSLDMARLDLISSLLGADIPIPNQDELPAEVVETLRLSREQMQGIPGAVMDLNNAERDFAGLSQAINRILHLAKMSAALPEEAQAQRVSMEAEFIGLATVIAKVGGRGGYRGPGLTIKTKHQAQGTLRIVKHLAAVNDSVTAQLREQKELLIEAVEQTINFLETMTVLYPKAASLSDIPNLLQRVSEVCGDKVAVLESRLLRGLH